MRDPNRLDNLYEQLHQVHKQYVPDWRFGQFISNFVSWWFSSSEQSDIWFEEDDEWIKDIQEFGNSLKPKE